MWKIARRPRWIAMLVLALVLAAGFAALGQWQLERAIASGQVVVLTTETVKPLSAITAPQKPTTENIVGQLIQARGQFVVGDFTVISNRMNRDETGYWVLGHAQVEGPEAAALAVAVGFTTDKRVAASALKKLNAAPDAAPRPLSGRYLATEAAEDAPFEKGVITTVSTAELINSWSHFDGATTGAYGGYLVLADPLAGLERIYSPPLTTASNFNWLNLFYAAEWVVFAGFAVYLWYRLVKDTWEREEEERKEAELAQSELVRVAAALA
ncbi:MAG: hypothetical protein H7248_05825 [Microbacteriaceae bacterium]|nr:hypothetical protein [Microbacteriaceae bacterium]